ncbi:MAG: hydroxysqualene dehydroxylase HpnE [Rhodospirillales bacterium]|nr:hydroxysqualene dehydroxylase HpnE [Rhodospirillales bacterium]
MGKIIHRATLRPHVNPPRHVHVVGAGLAGLAAATALAARGVPVSVYEAGPAAGGRARSYYDRELGAVIDNGNHLLLSGNRAAMAYLARIGARDPLSGPTRAIFPFFELPSGRRWTVAPNAGRIPWWILARSRRVPGARLGEYLALHRLMRARAGETVASLLAPGELSRRLLEPLAIAALNTMPADAEARLLGAVLEQTLVHGAAACRPLVAREGLSESFVDPARAFLAARGGTLRTGARLAAIDTIADRATMLRFAATSVRVEPDEAVVLAVPAAVAPALLPGLVAPDAFEAIVNLHYGVTAELPGGAGFIGIIGGAAEWLFARPHTLSVTISAANRVVDRDAEQLARLVWPEIVAAAGLATAPMPAWRVVKERRATFAATPAQNARRPGPRTTLANVLLAGDWTATGLPATIEGAIRSGDRAAALLLEPGTPLPPGPDPA